MTLSRCSEVRRRWLVVALLLAVAAALRVSTMFYHDLSGDDATVALMAKHFLAGEAFPTFFYRQAFMGSLNGVHLVPALFLFGRSVLTVRLNAVAYSLLFPLGLYVLGRRVFDEATARVALLLAAVPPFLLTYWSAVAEPHFETNTFGVVLLLLALAATAGDREPRYVRILACFGLTGGLACWTSFKALEILVPGLLLLWLRDPRLPLRRAGACLGGAFFLGGLPAWLFYATRGNPAAGTLGSVARVFSPQPEASGERLVELFLTVPPTLLGTYYWEVHGLARRIAIVLNLAIYGGACIAALVVGVRGIRSAAGSGRSRWGVWLLLLTLVSPFAMLYASGLELTFDRESARYVLPTYIPLFLFAAALVVWLGQRSRVAAAAVLAFLVVFDLWTNLAFMWPLDPRERAHRAASIAEAQSLARHLERERPEALYVGDMFESLKWAFRLRGVAVSHVSTEIYVPNAVAADAAIRVAYLDRAANPRIAAKLDALSASYRRTSFGRWVLLEDVRVPPRAFRLIPSTDWRVRGEGPGPVAAADGDLGTGWEPGPGVSPNRAAMTVDLGSWYSVARVIWWPATGWQETPAFHVWGSEDGEAWKPLGILPIYDRPGFLAGGRPFFRPRNGWFEVRHAPRRLHYLRFTADPTDDRPWWGVTELEVFEDAGPGAAGTLEGDALAALLRVRGVRRLLADPALSARVALATGGAIQTLPANGTLDSYGRSSPPAHLVNVVQLRAEDGLLVPHEEAQELEARLTVEGLTFTHEPVGDHVLFRALAPTVSSRPCRRTRWHVASRELEADGRTVRHVVEAQLQEAQRVVGLRIEHPLVSVRNATFPRVWVSEDGVHGRPVGAVRRLSEWVWAGRTLFHFSGGAEELLLPPTPARHVRVELGLPLTEEGGITQFCARGEPTG